MTYKPRCAKLVQSSRLLGTARKMPIDRNLRRYPSWTLSQPSRSASHHFASSIGSRAISRRIGRTDGSVIIRSHIPLGAYETHIPVYLARHATENPDRIGLPNVADLNVDGIGSRSPRASASWTACY